MTPRFADHAGVSAHLSLLSDHRLGELLARARPIGAGIGGTSALLEIGGVRVFVKRIPLTELEKRPENVRSTANLFGLPTWCQYGLGSPGFGVWRELAAHLLTTGWVLAGEHQGFPLLHHWRVLPVQSGAAALPEELADVDKAVGFWGGSTGVRERIEAIKESAASVVLFLEYFPHTLAEWLRDRRDDAPLDWVEQGLLSGMAAMNSRGLLHFDTHFENILTDGRRLCFADFGLALSSRFELSAAESGFLTAHRDYDQGYTLTALVHRLIAASHGETDLAERVRGFASGGDPVSLPEPAAVLVKRYAPVAVVLGRFRRDLLAEGLTAPYPADDVEKALTRSRCPGAR
ncbi:hypothetical protein [Amycolatopsis sp. H20-H5]|uniref:hypothetical protein n=1 Tax=Amycolatopsis sp. H20-H5 TaxID=3046309 RepID=UPI002DBB39E1|nr:hypothetical protein [Amycolatopsis sp. H20-H5]MEC3978467.1 hypothetical protein [Amycolatopsis sp. H20-H5]